MEAFLLKSNSCMEDMTKTIGDNQGRIGYLESLNKQLEGTVQVKNQQSEQVRSVPIAIPRSGRGVPFPTDPAFSLLLHANPAFPLLLHANPASRTSVISVPSTVFFHNTAYSAKILANQTTREAVKFRFPSRNFAFSRIPHYISQGYNTITEMSGRKVIPGSWGKNALFTVIVTSRLKNKTNYE